MIGVQIYLYFKDMVSEFRELWFRLPYRIQRARSRDTYLTNAEPLLDDRYADSLLIHKESRQIFSDLGLFCCEGFKPYFDHVFLSLLLADTHWVDEMIRNAKDFAQHIEDFIRLCNWWRNAPVLPSYDIPFDDMTCLDYWYSYYDVSVINIDELAKILDLLKQCAQRFNDFATDDDICQIGRLHAHEKSFSSDDEEYEDDEDDEE